jgi:hypothetical protein
MYRKGYGVRADTAVADSLYAVARAQGYDSAAAAEQARR